jgi:hypothetical protein
MRLRKVGGIYFARLGRLRFSFCLAGNGTKRSHKRKAEYLPIVCSYIDESVDGYGY